MLLGHQQRIHRSRGVSVDSVDPTPKTDQCGHPEIRMAAFHACACGTHGSGPLDRGGRSTHFHCHCVLFEVLSLLRSCFRWWSTWCTTCTAGCTSGCTPPPPSPPGSGRSSTQSYRASSRSWSMRLRPSGTAFLPPCGTMAISLARWRCGLRAKGINPTEGRQTQKKRVHAFARCAA